jgi:ABC-type glutathione transport system ATPase component
VFGRETRKPVLADISLEIRRGEIFGLVGESGCGKTTLGRCILGLIDYEGEIIIDGLTQRGQHNLEMARRVGAVFQDPGASLNPAKRVGWLMEEPLRVHRLGGKKERARRVDEMLDLIGLDPAYRERRVTELSAGQKQRLSIGCALMLRPRLLIADEAISALDASVGAQILNLFRELHQSLDLSILFISHNLNVVYYLSGRIAVMRKGRIVETGSAEDICTSPAHEYTRALIKAAEW